MANTNISFTSLHQQTLYLEDNIRMINESDYSRSTQILALVTSCLILVLILPVTTNILKSKVTFINILVLLDCLISAAHVPILLQYVM